MFEFAIYATEVISKRDFIFQKNTHECKYN